MRFKFYNVGNGRKIKLENENIPDKNVFLDCGTSYMKKNSFSHEKVCVDTLILSHLHFDHYGLVEKFNKDANLYWNAYGLPFTVLYALVANEGKSLKEFLEKIKEAKIYPKNVFAKNEIDIGNEKIQVHFPMKGEDEVYIKNIKREFKKIEGEYPGLKNTIKNISVLYTERYIFREDEETNAEKDEDGNKLITKIIDIIELNEKNNIIDLNKKNNISEDDKLLKKLTNLAHEYNVVCSFKQEIFLPGDIHKKNISKLNPSIEFSDIKFFELPHHGSNKQEYYAKEYEKRMKDGEDLRIVRSCANEKYNFYSIKERYEIHIYTCRFPLRVYTVFPIGTINIKGDYWKNKIICTSCLMKKNFLEYEC